MIVVTGASGLLGINIIAATSGLSREVAGTCYHNALRVPGVQIRSVDLTDRQATREVIATLRPTASFIAPLPPMSTGARIIPKRLIK